MRRVLFNSVLHRSRTEFKEMSISKFRNSWQPAHERRQAAQRFLSAQRRAEMARHCARHIGAATCAAWCLKTVEDHASGSMSRRETNKGAARQVVLEENSSSHAVWRHVHVEVDDTPRAG